MLNPVWSRAIKASADPQRVKHFFHLFSETARNGSRVSPEQAGILAALFSGSEALTNLLVANADWLGILEPEKLKFARRKQGFVGELGALIEPSLRNRDYETALKSARQFKQREMFRIGARDLAHLGDVLEITRELSDLADVCLNAVWTICSNRLAEKYGRPFHRDAGGRWRETQGCVLGMGKLGGQELNYSSDVDVLFVYEEEGSVHFSPPGSTLVHRAGLTNHQFYCRVSEMFIAEVSRMAPEGMLYRIDLRLRPEGKVGPLARSLESYENYYAQWGQTWERMMMIKARGVAGDDALAAEFLEMVQPFRYPRSISADVLREVADMKDRIENEVVKEGELDRNVKLGRGGIREIEFVAQAQQLLHAGRQPFLQGNQTVPCLEKLAQYQLLEAGDAAALREAYCFLRDVEHRLQMEGNLQTHTIPADRQAQERLARLMGFKTLKAFEAGHQAHRKVVRKIFHKVLKSEVTRADGIVPFPQKFEGGEEEWKALLKEYGFRDLDKAFRVLREFVEGPGYVHVSPRTRELAMKLLPRLLSRGEVRSERGEGSRRDYRTTGPRTTDLSRREQVDASSPRPSPPKEERERAKPRSILDTRHSTLVQLSDPDRVVTRLDSFITAYGARSTLFELWNSNPAIFDLLVLLFDRSEFLAELAIRTPDLVDELVISGRLRHRKTSAETLEDLRHGINDADQHAWIRKYHQAELMRIGLRDILGLAGEEQYLVELSALADACLQYALEVVLKRKGLNRLNELNKLPESHGSDESNELDTEAPFAIIGLGKLGGAEIDYGSDLDLLFVTAEHPKGWTPNGKNLVKLGRMAAEVMDLLSRRTEDGLVFHTDARLRPDGEKGLLVNTLGAYEEYYRQRAALWEIQSLTRTRAVAGNAEIGAAFQEMAAELTNFKELSLLATREIGKQRASSPRPSPPGEERGSARNWPKLEREVGNALPAAYTPKWKEEIHRMRMRIEKERTPAGKDDLAIKTGKGGLVDAEFVAQALCLENGWHEANTLKALERWKLEVMTKLQAPNSKLQRSIKLQNSKGRPKKRTLSAPEWQKKGTEDRNEEEQKFERMIQGYRKLRRVEGVLRRWSYEGETVLPDDPAPYYRVAVRCGFETAEEFRKAVAEWRREIRKGYEMIMTNETPAPD